jgi:hypothetical protein
MKIIVKIKEAVGLKKPNGLVAKMKTRRRIKRLRADPRFMLYLSSLRPNLVFTPAIALVSMRFVSVPMNDSLFELLYYYMKFVAFAVTALIGVSYIYMEHSRFIRMTRKLQSLTKR